MTELYMHTADYFIKYDTDLKEYFVEFKDGTFVSGGYEIAAEAIDDAENELKARNG